MPPILQDSLSSPNVILLPLLFKILSNLLADYIVFYLKLNPRVIFELLGNNFIFSDNG